MKIFKRTALACVMAASATILASCSGGSGYSGPPGVLQPGGTPTPVSTASATTTTAPATTAPATTAPATTAPGSTTAPATTMPATTAPATTAPGSTTPPATTAPATTAPATTAPATTAPATTAPATTAPAATPTGTTTMMTAVCPPTTIPTPVMTTVPFPTGNGGSITNPLYYDSSGTTMFPANNAASGTTITIKIGGNNYDSFPATADGGTPLVYIESSTTSAQAITFTGSNAAVVITATSDSCFTSGHSYDIDTDVSGLTLNTAVGVASNSGHTQMFSITTAAKQFPTGTVQNIIYMTS